MAAMTSSVAGVKPGSAFVTDGSPTVLSPKTSKTWGPKHAQRLRKVTASVIVWTFVQQHSAVNEGCCGRPELSKTEIPHRGVGPSSACRLSAGPLRRLFVVAVLTPFPLIIADRFAVDGRGTVAGRSRLRVPAGTVAGTLGDLSQLPAGVASLTPPVGTFFGTNRLPA